MRKRICQAWSSSSSYAACAVVRFVSIPCLRTTSKYSIKESKKERSSILNYYASDRPFEYVAAFTIPFSLPRLWPSLPYTVIGILKFDATVPDVQHWWHVQSAILMRTRAFSLDRPTLFSCAQPYFVQFNGTAGRCDSCSSISDFTDKRDQLSKVLQFISIQLSFLHAYDHPMQCLWDRSRNHFLLADRSSNLLLLTLQSVRYPTPDKKW